MRLRSIFILVFFASLLFLALTVPENHTEAEDAYEYARLAESGGGSELFHGHHLLYLPLARGLLRLVQAAGYTGRSFPVLVGLSVVCGALTVAFLTALLAFKTGKKRALPFGFGLLFSYGFWRYACEVEIYIPALCVAVAVFWLLHLPNDQCRSAIAAILLSWLGICVHVLNAIPLLAGVSVFYLMSRKPGRAVAHALFSGLLVAVTYLVVSNTVGIHLPAGDTQPLEGGVNWAMFSKGAVGFFQSLVSGNFLFICPVFQRCIQSLFPYRLFVEEIYMGARLPMWSFYAALTSSILGLAGMLLLLVDLGRRRGRDFWPVEWSPSLVAALVWLLGLAGVVLLFEPGNPEMWVMGLLPLWWCVALFSCRFPRPLQRLTVALVVLLGVHNWVGGMALIQSRSGDYNARKLEWLLSQNQFEDALVVTAESHVFISYLNYRGDATVLNLNGVTDYDAAVCRIQSWPGSVYILNEVFDPFPALSSRSCLSKGDMKQMADLLRANSVLAHKADAGCVYQYAGKRRLLSQ